MQDVKIPWPPGIDCRNVEQAIDGTLAAAGLLVSLQGTLEKFPGCIHWHAKNQGDSGTLEITLWPQERRAWFTIQDGRRADWIKDKMKLVKDEILRQLGG